MGFEGVPNNLSGPFELNNETIDEYVFRDDLGVYALGNLVGENHFDIKYVGRTRDDPVRERLKRQIVMGWDHFCFRYCDNELETYKEECYLWHDYNDQIKNFEKHPEVDPGECDNPDWICPYGDCNHPNE